ncbi:hypothetical protein TWF281_010379 [Arthrobotrys megalospora]
MQQTTHFLPLLILGLVVVQISALNDTKIDFSTVPSCARSHCLEASDSPYTWTPQNLCPSSNPSEGIKPSCFCNLPRPLICLPYDPTDENPCYTPLKSWYTNLCNSTVGITPNTTLPYLQIPFCARSCAAMMTSHLGCPDHSLNCACQLNYLAGNTAECIKSTCESDIALYIGDLTTFTSKWLYQACYFSNSTLPVPEELSVRSNTEEYKNSPAASPQETLVADFEGSEYTNWQKALDDKRARKSNLGVIIPLSLVFGGIFGALGLQWLAACCGYSIRARRRWDKAGQIVGKVFGFIGIVFAWVGKGVGFLWLWLVKGCKAVWNWVT